MKLISEHQKFCNDVQIMFNPTIVRIAKDLATPEFLAKYKTYEERLSVVLDNYHPESDPEWE